MLDSVLKTIKENNMLSINDRVVVAVSGGPDSIALLHVLYSLSADYSLYIHAAHLNHMLRGEEADGDTEYVRDFCRKLGIPCTIEYADINKMAQELGLSSEEAGRKARYQLFSRVAGEVNANKIALAHNMNDQAETVLMRIMRGTGLEGLCGIRPVRDSIYIRPLIETSRKDIEGYCVLNKLNPRIDSTNLEPIYARNKVRLEMLPYIKENFNNNIEYSLSSMAKLLCEDNDFLNEYVNNIYKDIVSWDAYKASINISEFNKLHGAIKKRIVRNAVERVKGDLNGIESKHVELVMSIADECRTGAAVELPGRIRVSVSYGSLVVSPFEECSTPRFNLDLKVPGVTYIEEIFGSVKAEILNETLTDYKSSNRYIKYFDYDKIKDKLSVRCREDGDYIVPFGMKGRKKLKELFIDNKVPRDERYKIPLIASGSEIIWIIGISMNDNYKINRDTKKVLKLEFKQSGGNNNVK